MTTVRTQDRLLPASVMTFSPNPTAGEMTVQIDLKNATQARMTITDLTGKIMYLRNFDALQNESIQMDLGEYPNGTYLVRLVTENGARTWKVVVQR